MATEEVTESKLRTLIHDEISKAIPHQPERVESKNETHPIYDFMQSCPNCGQPNTEYKPTLYRCDKCKVPVIPDRTDKCWNCGNKHYEKRPEEVEEENEEE